MDNKQISPHSGHIISFDIFIISLVTVFNTIILISLFLLLSCSTFNSSFILNPLYVKHTS